MNFMWERFGGHDLGWDSGSVLEITAMCVEELAALPCTRTQGFKPAARSSHQSTFWHPIRQLWAQDALENDIAADQVNCISTFHLDHELSKRQKRGMLNAFARSKEKPLSRSC